MPIVFSNPGLLDIRAVQTMGLSVKEHTNSIGRFGTGLKYAIATLLRHKNDVAIWVGKDCWTFFPQNDTFRGQPVQFIWMKKNREAAQPLGITTQLGKDWELWMAMRELESNCRDERGTSSNMFSFDDDDAAPDQTNIVVSGTMEREYDRLDTIFLKSKPIYDGTQISIHQAANPEQRGWIFYRGVRCGKLEKPSLYVYNIKSTCYLTEDRTFTHSWEPVMQLTVGLIECDVEDILFTILSAKEQYFEHGLDFRGRWYSEEYPEVFHKVVKALGVRGNSSAYMAVLKSEMDKGAVPVDNLETHHVVMLEKARHFIARMGHREIKDFEVKVAHDLGENVLGKVFRAQPTVIWLATRCFEMGFKQVVSTLYEEFIHQHRGYDDQTIEMQNFLFDKIIEMASKYFGEPI